MSAVLSRSALVRRHAVFRSRLAAPSRFSSGHGEYHHLPFALPGNKKLLFGVKLTAYLATGFSIPFIASWYQLRKASGAA